LITLIASPKAFRPGKRISSYSRKNRTKKLKIDMSNLHLMIMKDTRRDFIKKSSLAAAGLTAAGLSGIPDALFAKERIPPSDRINIGLIGCRGRGFSVLREHLDIAGVNCLGMCDVDKNVLEKRSAEVKSTYDQKPKLYKDYRKMLEDKDLDAVLIGTPDHWHCLQTVHACQAGKDVYVEKPLANSIEECNIMVRAANQYNRVVQVGQQQRSGRIWLDVMDHIKSGKIGKLVQINTIQGHYGTGAGPEKQPDKPVPEGVDYDLWLGPAPKRSFNPARFHGSWRYFWDYGGGRMTDWGVHLLDMALWAMDTNYPPAEAMAHGGNWTLMEGHCREVFNTLSVIYKMKDHVITWNENIDAPNGPYQTNHRVEFVGEKGMIIADRHKWYLYAGGEPVKNVPEWDYPHAENFLDCIRTRNKPNCPIESARNAAVCAHMGNIAIRSGAGRLIWDDEKNRFSNDEKANDYIVPEYRKPWDLPKV